MPENYILIERTELNATAASVTFANIPQTGYTDLKIVASLRGTSPFATMQLYMTFNGSTTGYSTRQVYGDGSSATSATLSNSGAAISIINMNTTQSTANTFSNTEIYIPNYTSSSNKSVSADSVTENNATGGALAGMTAGLWSNTAAITSITFTNQSAYTFLANSTFSLYGIAAVGTTPAIAPKASGGNRIDNDGTYWYHTFTSSGAFVPQTGLIADVLVIAGGGGGGNNRGGGGGAGGVLSFSSQSLTSGTTNICTIGAGGAGAPAGTNTGGTVGVDSQFAALTLVKGGGYGGGIVTLVNGGTGGSGGGGGGNSGPGVGSGGSNTSGQGNVGGGGTGNSAGGGGGSGTAGQTAPSTSAGGTGGAGLNTWSSWATATSTGVSGFFAGGGGAGTYPSGTVAGGSGGAGTGGSSSVAATAATVNTGSGGGGSGETGAGGAGGSGIIIVRYPIA